MRCGGWVTACRVLLGACPVPGSWEDADPAPCYLWAPGTARPPPSLGWRSWLTRRGDRPMPAGVKSQVSDASSPAPRTRRRLQTSSRLGGTIIPRRLLTASPSAPTAVTSDPAHACDLLRPRPTAPPTPPHALAIAGWHPARQARQPCFGPASRSSSRDSEQRAFLHAVSAQLDTLTLTYRLQTTPRTQGDLRLATDLPDRML